MNGNSNFIGGFSPKLAKENLKQLWYIPTLIFIFYFLAGIFPLMFLSDGYEGTWAQGCLENNNFFFGNYILYFTLIVACIMMSFYHKPEKAFALHSQPYSRAKLFNTQILTGWIMMIIPLIVMAIIYLVIMGGITIENIPEDWNWDSGKMLPLVQAYFAKDVLIWLLNSVALYTFFYGIFVLAGSLVGNTVMQVLGSGVLFVLVPVIMITIIVYESAYLVGFSEPSDLEWNIVINSNPLFAKVVEVFASLPVGEATRFKFLAEGWYFLFGVILLILAKFACFKAKLEKVGDSMIFRPVEAVITVLISFIGAAVTGMIFRLIFDSIPMLLFGMIIGAALTFFIVKLIMARTVRIFNKTNLKTFLALMIVILIFVLTFVFDIFGFAKILPKASDITSVQAVGMVTNDSTLYDHNLSISGTDMTEYPRNNYIEDSSITEKCLELNRYIVDNKCYVDNNDTYLDNSSESKGLVMMQFSYKLKNGGHFERKYTVCVDDKIAEMANVIINDKTVKDQLKIDEDYADIVSYADVDYYEDGNVYFQVTNKTDVAGLIEAYNKDIDNARFDLRKDFNYEDADTGEVYDGYDYYNSYISIYTKSDSGRDGPNINFVIGENDKETIKLIKSLMDKYEAEKRY